MSLKRYKVTGVQPVEGHAPGESFDADLGDDKEKFLLGIGAVRVVSNDPTSDKRMASDAPKSRGKKKG